MTGHSSPWDVDRCFVCEGPLDPGFERKGRWLRRRCVCEAHHRRAVLPTGESLSDFRERHRDAGMMEGFLLNFILNPVSIDDQRAWLEWGMGAAAPIEEIFPADDYHDYQLQHATGYLDELLALHEWSMTASRTPSLLRRAARYNQVIGSMVGDDLYQQEVTRRARQCPGRVPARFEDACEILDEAPLAQPARAWWEWVFGGAEERLLRVARRRFAHLPRGPRSGIVPKP